MPTNILHSTNSAVSASLAHMHFSENVNYRESFVTQPNTLAGLNSLYWLRYLDAVKRKVQAGQGTSDICLGPASFTLSDQTRPEAKCVSRDRSRKVRTN